MRILVLRTFPGNTLWRTAVDIGGIVAADLRNSGKFNPLDRARLPQQPGSAQEVQPAAWSALGIDAVVVG
ncbi:hypothetical protein ACUOCP_09770, partial [Escherichia sp. R-CC3]